MSNKLLSNQSNSNIIIPTSEEISKIGFKETNFDILSDYSRKAYYFESEDKYSDTDKMFSKSNIVFVPELNPGVIRIASYNVHNWVTIFQKYEKKRNLDNFLLFFKTLDADVLCLQEVTPLFPSELKNNVKASAVRETYNFKFLVKMMKKIGYEYSTISNNIVGNPYWVEDRGYYVLANAIFSKIPFEKETYYLTGNRSLAIAHFKTKIFNFSVLNTHIEYGKNKFDLKILKNKFGEEDLRVIQVKEIMEIYKSMIGKRENIFICGDFNDSFKSSRLKPIFDNFISLKINTNTNINNNITTDFVSPSKECFKNIFIYDYNAIEAKLSDHFPVFLDFVPNNQKELINSLSYKKKIVNIEKPIQNFNYIKDLVSNSVTDYVTFKYSNLIISQYYLDIKSWYYNPNLEPMYNIGPFDYVSLVKKLVKINPYYQKYAIYADLYNNKMIKIKKSDNNRNYIEDMLLQFIKCRPNMKVITIWPSINYNEHKKELGEILEENGDIYYVKEIGLDYWEAMSLIYQLYLTTDRNKTISHLNYNVTQKGWDAKNPNLKKNINIIFYEHKKGGEISGHESEFKTQLRSLWKTNSIRPYDILHINDYFQETIDYAGLYLNANSLNLLKKQNIKELIKITQFKQIVYINTLKKTLYQNFSQDDIIRFIFYSSIILFLYGLRRFNDIDGYIYPLKNAKFDKKYNELFDVSSNSFIPFLDISYQNSKAFEDYIQIFLNKVAFIYDKIKYEDVVFDPKYHFYFYGIKFQLIEFEIIKRIYRFRPACFADLIVIKERLNYPIMFPSIPKQIKHYYKNMVDKDYIIKTIGFYLKKNYGINKTYQEIEAMISNFEITSNIDNKNINKDINFFKKIFNA